MHCHVKRWIQWYQWLVLQEVLTYGFWTHVVCLLFQICGLRIKMILFRCWNLANITQGLNFACVRCSASVCLNHYLLNDNMLFSNFRPVTMIYIGWSGMHKSCPKPREPSFSHCSFQELSKMARHSNFQRIFTLPQIHWNSINLDILVLHKRSFISYTPEFYAQLVVPVTLFTKKK